MGELRDFVSDVLEIEGSAVEAVEPDGLEVLAPEPLRTAMGWPELVRLGFGATLPAGALAVGFEGDWLDRFGALLRDRGRWAERQLALPDPMPLIAYPERLLDHALDLPNAIWRLHGVSPAWARCLLLAFRYTAVSDEKREGLVWLGFNQGTGAVIDGVLARLRPLLAADTEWQVPDPDVRRCRRIRRGIRPLSKRGCGRCSNTACNSKWRRFCARCDAVSTAIATAFTSTTMICTLVAQKKLASIAGTSGEKAAGDRKREMLRLATIEREYSAKLDDLRRNYALRVTIEWAQGLELFVPVQRFEVLVKRRKGERLIRIDWHPTVRLIELPPSDWGLGLERSRLVCDDRLHVTDADGQSACRSCGRAFCRACHPIACPRCGQAIR